MRNLTTIGSSFKSSFSLAGTSMEYVRKTDFTSAACTEIYYENISSQEFSPDASKKDGSTNAYGRVRKPKHAPSLSS